MPDGRLSGREICNLVIGEWELVIGNQLPVTSRRKEVRPIFKHQILSTKF